MYQVPPLTIEYQESRAPICPPSCDADKVVPTQVIDSPQPLPTEWEVTVFDDVQEFPTWSLGATGPGREMA
jgi:hypothetical protein